MHVFDCLDRSGRFLFLFPLAVCLLILICYSWIFFSDFDLGWLAAPLTLLLLDLCVLLFRGTAILAGGIGVARVLVGAVFVVFVCGFRAILSQ